MWRPAGALVLAVVLAGCGGSHAEVPRVPATGPANLIRVAVERLDEPAVQSAFGGLHPRFRLVSADARRVVGARGDLRLEFVRMEPHAAAVAFRRAEVDVAPVPLGDLRAALLDPALRGSVRVRTLDGVDLVRLDRRIPLAVRRLLWDSAGREDYRALVSEREAPVAYGLLRSAPTVKRPSLRDLRAVTDDEAFPDVQVRIRGGYEAQLLAAFWREAGFDVIAGRPPYNARFERVVARYPGPRWLFAAVLGPRALRESPAALDRRLRTDATIVPIAWVASAKLVSRRLVGWRQDALGTTDYSRVRVHRTAVLTRG